MRTMRQRRRWLPCVGAVLLSVNLAARAAGEPGGAKPGRDGRNANPRTERERRIKDVRRTLDKVLATTTYGPYHLLEFWCRGVNEGGKTWLGRG